MNEMTKVSDAIPIPGAAQLATQEDQSAYKGLLCEQWCDWHELTMRDLKRPVLLPGQVRLAIHHAGVGFALKLFVSGKYQRKPPLPFTPGTEASGIVLEVGEGVTHIRVGQRVAAALDWGAFAQEAVTTAATVYPVPDALPLSIAAALPLTYGTTWAALNWRAQLQKREVLLVFGASGALGTAAVQIGRALGAEVIAVASTADKRAAALEHGAHHVLEADAENLPQQIKTMTSGRGVDVVFDPVGGAFFDGALRCTAAQGRILTIGYASGSIPQIPANLLLVKNISVIGFNYGYFIGWGLTDERLRYADTVQAMMAMLFDAMASGRLEKPRIQPYAFDQWMEGVEATMNRRSVGKVILSMV